MPLHIFVLFHLNFMPHFRLSATAIASCLVLFSSTFCSCCHTSYRFSNILNLSVPASATLPIILLSCLCNLSWSCCPCNFSNDHSVSAVLPISILFFWISSQYHSVPATPLSYSLPPSSSDEHSAPATNIKIIWLLQYSWWFCPCNSPVVILFILLFPWAFCSFNSSPGHSVSVALPMSILFLQLVSWPFCPSSSPEVILFR